MSRNLQARPEETNPDVFPPNAFASGHPIQPLHNSEDSKLNARAVELIARPGKAEALRAFICRQLLHVLAKRSGFESLFVMTSHNEPRLVVVVSLWRTRKQATETQWENEPGFRQMASEMLDVCGRVQTYETLLTVAPEAAKPVRLELC